MKSMDERLFEHFAGSALGSFIGDAMGMPVEGWFAEEIRQKYGYLDKMISGRFPAGWYTDDTEMMISILEALVITGGADPALVASRFLTNFHPERGYGARIYGIMELLARGESWERVGTDSFGNGSAMRVAPIGFFYYDDLEKTARAAVAQASITHRHPEALAGAVIQAGAVALAVRAGLNNEPVDKFYFLNSLAELGREWDEKSADRLLHIMDIKPGPPKEIISQVTRLYDCNVKAIEAVPPSLAAFLFADDFKQAVTLAVNFGGDTDTIGAMAGAVAGAYHGLTGLPAEWLNMLENKALGRDYVAKLCRDLAGMKADWFTKP